MMVPYQENRDERTTPKRMDWSLTGTIALLTISILFIYSAQFQATGSVGSTWQNSFSLVERASGFVS